MSGKMKALVKQANAQGGSRGSLENYSINEKTAEQLFVQGQLIGRGFLYELQNGGTEKEAASFKGLLTGAKELGGKAKERVVGTAGKTDEAFQDFGTTIIKKLRKKKPGRPKNISARRARTVGYGVPLVGAAGAGAGGLGLAKALRNNEDEE